MSTPQAVEWLKLAFANVNLNYLAGTLNSSIAMATRSSAWLVVQMLSRFIDGAELCPVVRTQLEMWGFDKNYCMYIYIGSSHSLDCREEGPLGTVLQLLDLLLRDDPEAAPFWNSCLATVGCSNTTTKCCGLLVQFTPLPFIFRHHHGRCYKDRPVNKC